jgi:hypothetical protein
MYEGENIEKCSQQYFTANAFAGKIEFDLMKENKKEFIPF